MIHLPPGRFYDGPHYCVNFNDSGVVLRHIYRWKVPEVGWSQPHCYPVPRHGAVELVEIEVKYPKCFVGPSGLKEIPKALFKRAIFKDIEHGNLWACTNYYQFKKFRSLASLVEAI